MPWHIEADNAGCEGFAVVKDENGELEGCHRTRSQAERQLAALYASEPEARAPGVPTGEMREEARRGLDWREEYGRGGTSIGVARARDIVNGRTLSPSTIRRMRSYFARHEVDKEGEGFSPGEPGYPSAGRIAWALWGGDPGKTWVEDQIRDMEDRAEGDEPLIITDIDGTVLVAGTRPIRPVIDEINAASVEVYVLSGREESSRAETEAALRAAGLNFDEVYLVGSQEAKKPLIDEWAAEYDIVAAYENDETIRGYYRDLGIPLGPIVVRVQVQKSRIAQVEEILAELRAARYSSK